MITRQIFEQMLEAEKIFDENLRALKRENAALRAYIRDIEGHTVEYAKKWGSPLLNSKATPLDHSAEYNTRKVYE
jgi:hypothetical protein